jgi:hypothetical protein
MTAEEKEIRLDNSLATTALPPVTNNPLYKDLVIRIGAFKLANPQLTEEKIQEQLGKHIRNYIANKKGEWKAKVSEYLGEIHRRHKQNETN